VIGGLLAGGMTYLLKRRDERHELRPASRVLLTDLHEAEDVLERKTNASMRTVSWRSTAAIVMGFAGGAGRLLSSLQRPAWLSFARGGRAHSPCPRWKSPGLL
jgi:hypothetical protein